MSAQSAPGWTKTSLHLSDADWPEVHPEIHALRATFLKPATRKFWQSGSQWFHVRQLFICHKELFYQHYMGWSDSKREFVADFLAREYQVDKAGTRAALFGPEPGMAAPAPMREIERKVKLVGPWGAVGR